MKADSVKSDYLYVKSCNVPLLFFFMLEADFWNFTGDCSIYGLCI